MVETVELLFFDTFAHENSEKLNLDLVQFPKPVHVTEVRIIPLGARVQADFPGGVRLGATNPSQFSIEFFVNDLGKPGASTFESLGGFEYNQNGCINLEWIDDELVRKIPTDGLVLRGTYTTITLAVYGILTANIAEQLIPAVVTPSLPPQATPVVDIQQIPTTPIENEWAQETIQPVPVEYSQQTATPYPQAYGQPEPYPQEYPEYYTEVPKDPRSYHHTPEPEWDSKSRGRSIEHERDRERDRGRDIERYQKPAVLERIDPDRRDRDRQYSRSHSRDRDRSTRDYKETSRDRDWEHERTQPLDYRERCDKDWDREHDRDRDRSYKHQEPYHRTYARDDREEIRKRPRTPPISSPKRPHTPHSDHKELSPADVETFSEDEFEKQRREREGQILATRKSPPMEVKEALPPPPVEDVAQIDEEEFEPILSDEDMVDDSEHFQDLEYDYTAYTNNDDLIKLFIPGTTELQKFSKPEPFKITDSKIDVSEDLKITIAIADDFFKSSITKYTLSEFKKMNREIKEEFVHLCEKITTTIDEIESFCCIVKLYNLTEIISDSILDDSEKNLKAQVKFITETLIDWIKIALSFEMANVQTQPAYKIRHIKCGVRLAEWSCNCLNFIQLLWHQSYYIHRVLLELYNREFMALSIKLMILQALDTYLLHKPAIECFVLGKYGDEFNENGFSDSLPFSEQNGYKALVEITQRNPSVRLKFALNSILKKLNFCELLYKLQRAVAMLRTNQGDASISEVVGFIIKSLQQISQASQGDVFVVSQPKRFLPVSAQFEINRSELKNPWIKSFEMHNLLEAFVVLLALPATMNLSAIKTPVYEILAELLASEPGLQYLSANCTTVNLLLRCLLQNDEELQYALPDSVEIKSHNLGLKIAYKLQCLYHVEFLVDRGSQSKIDCDSVEIIDQLHAFFCLTFATAGKFACAEVLGLKNHIKSLLQFVNVLNAKEKSEVQFAKLKKSPAFGYVVDLLYFAIVYVPNVPLLDAYSKSLLHIINHKELFDPSVVQKINEFAPYLLPFESIALTYDNIMPIIEIVTKYAESVTTYHGQMITCLRILQHLGISPYADKSPVLLENPLNNYIELKYKHVILQLFSLDGVSLLTKILQQICEHYEQPNLHTTTFVSTQGVQIVSTVQPCVILLKQMLTYVIQCRNTSFRDLTTIPALLQTYNLLRAFPGTSLTYFKAQKICETIIETLLVYTQPVSEEVNEKDSLNKTLWTLMCGEVIKYVTAAPYTFVSGLLVFSELLPLPLPIQTREELTNEEVLWAVNLRKLWSAHLHAHSVSLQELINKICVSTYQPLLNLLRRVCIQLSDLAANSAIMVARGMLDIVYNALITSRGLISDDEPIPICNGNTARILNFLACLVTHSTLKCAILHLLCPNNANLIKGDEKYPTLIQAFAQIVRTPSTTNAHIQSQECILSIIQSFCDTEVTLLQTSTDEKIDINSEVYLANSMPTKENLLVFIATIIEHLMTDNSCLTYLPIVRTLLLLTEHDYGFFHLKEHLCRKTEPLLNVLDKLNDNFCKDSAECLSTLNTLVEFLRVCATPEEVDEALLYKPRGMKMSLAEIRALVGWKKGENGEKEAGHPLCILENYVKKIVQEDKAFESLLEGITAMLSLLESDTESDLKDSYWEPILPPPESLLVQFAGRPVFTISDAIDERLTSVYWLSPPADEGETDMENIPCDITEICRQHLPPDVNLIKEVEKLCRICPSNNGEQNDANKPKGISLHKDKTKKPFITPMARRGFPRTVQSRPDLFRSRPPNTSRPPSLHVDDFVALETCGAQPTGPTGYNKISRELLATSRVARGSRGRAFVTSERAVHYRQMSWWGSGVPRNPYQ